MLSFFVCFVIRLCRPRWARKGYKGDPAFEMERIGEYDSHKPKWKKLVYGEAADYLKPDDKYVPVTVRAPPTIVASRRLATPSCCRCSNEMNEEDLSPGQWRKCRPLHLDTSLSDRMVRSCSSLCRL